MEVAKESLFSAWKFISSWQRHFLFHFSPSLSEKDDHVSPSSFVRQESHFQKNYMLVCNLEWL